MFGNNCLTNDHIEIMRFLFIIYTMSWSKIENDYNVRKAAACFIIQLGYDVM